MTAKGRLNARLDPEMVQKVSYLRRRTGLGTSDLVRASIEHYYQAVRARGVQAREILEGSGFVGSGEGDPDLSEGYKARLETSLGRKHS
jgi:hypothetical protein